MPNSMELFGNLLQGKLPALRKKYGHDVVWGAHFAARQAEILRSKTSIYAEDAPPNVWDMVIKSWDDIEKLTIPDDFESHPSFQIFAETIGKLNAALNGTCPVCAFLVGSFSLPSILMGMESRLDLMLTGPKTLKDELLTRCSDFTIKMFQAFKKAGAAMIAYSNPFASSDILPLKRVEALALDWIVRDAIGCGGDGFVCFSGGGRIDATIPWLIDRAGIGAFYINPNDDVAEAKSLAAGRAIIAGSINDIPLINSSRDEIRASVKRIMADGAPGGGFIFGSLVMPHNIPDANIHTLIQAGHEYGGYSDSSVS